MPHDRKGHELQAGDLIMIEAIVRSVSPGEEYCNLTLDTVEPMYPADTKTCIVLNARQVTLR